MKYGGYFIEADLPSPLMGYPGALGIDLVNAQGDFPKILKAVEEKVIKDGGKGRFGTWAYSYGFTLSAGLVEYAKRVIEGKAKIRELPDIIKAFSTFTPGANWNGALYTDAHTGITAKNHVLIYQDTYIFGKGYLKTTDVKVPKKYYAVK